jgi:2-keto-4-pentenoate hydratase/2-oxohepta-3-ene-1,7-dioic acid hydratase in catechol pathway
MDRIYRIRNGMGGRYAVERDGNLRWLEGDVFGEYSLRGDVKEPATLKLLSPVMPSKIVAIGLNYKDHAVEMGRGLPEEPLMFIKPPSAVIGPEEPIRMPMDVGEIHYEAEMAVVIGRRAERVKARDAGYHILGVTCLNDVTARDLRKKEVQYTRAKGFDTFAPLGPCIAVGLDGSDLNIEGWVNGEKKQSSNTRQLIFPVDHLVEFISFVMTLNPGDVITTGTPAGVGPLTPGDRVMVKIEGVGTLSNPVVER